MTERTPRKKKAKKAKQSRKPRSGLSVPYEDKRARKTRYLKVFRDSDVKDVSAKYIRLKQVLRNLESQHNKLRKEKKTVGDPTLDKVENQIDGVLNALLDTQIELDEGCDRAKTMSECGAHCRWVEEEWRWYHVFYTRKGLCISKERASITGEKYQEGLEQLQDVTRQIKILSAKKRLSASDKAKLRYLAYLKKKLNEVVQQDLTTYRDIGRLTALITYYKQTLDACTSCSTAKRNLYHDLISEAEQTLKKLQEKRHSSRVRWAIVAGMGFLVTIAAYYGYTQYIAANVSQIQAKTQLNKSATETFHAHNENLKTQEEVLGRENVRAEKVEEIQGAKLTNQAWEIAYECGAELLQTGGAGLFFSLAGLFTGGTTWIVAAPTLAAQLFRTSGCASRALRQRASAPTSTPTAVPAFSSTKPEPPIEPTMTPPVPVPRKPHHDFGRSGSSGTFFRNLRRQRQTR